MSFWLHSFCGWDPVNRFNNTSWVAIVTPTDRSKSVRNRCVIEVFCGVCVLSRCFLGCFLLVQGFCHRTKSDLFLFLLLIFESRKSNVEVGNKCQIARRYWDFYTPVFRRDVLWYGDVRPSGSPSDSPSVRLSVRPSGSPSAHFPHFSHTCFDILSWNFAHHFVLMYYRSSSSVVTLRQFLKELCVFWNLEYR